MNILCISPSFVPVADSEAYCGAKVAIALKERGASVTVLSMGLSHPSSEGRRDDSGLWREALGMNIGISIPSSQKNLASLWLGGRFHTVVYARWIDCLVKRARELHTKEPFDVVYSRSLPMIAHVAGYWASRALGVPWAANINDPWDYHLFPNGRGTETSRLEAAFSEYWLKKTLRCADLVTYPSARLRDYNSNIAGEEPGGEIIPHIGYTCSDVEPAGDFNLVHAGKLGSNEWSGRPTDSLLKGLAGFLEANKTACSVTRFTLVGPVDKATESLAGKLGLSSVVRHIGRVNYEESIRHIRSATICVLVETEGAEGIFLPSKLADYLVSRKPVLALSPSVGVLSDMVSQGGIIRVSPTDERGIAEAIGQLYKAFRSRSLQEYTPPERLVRQFEAGHIAEKLFSDFSGIIRKMN